MKKIKYQILILFLFLPVSSLKAQSLIIHDLDSAGNETGKRSIAIGDVVVIAHSDGGNMHYFQGKVTGIFKDRNVIRVFDYARSTRVVSIAGKKISINDIKGIKKIEDKDFDKRETGAVMATVAGAVGTGIGGKTGDAIQWGSSAAAVGIDFSTRQQIGRQRIKVEISDY